jgi:DNA-binding beta-propeller fold protein YncE
LTAIGGLPVSGGAAPSPIGGSPYATDLTPAAIAISAVNNFVYVANTQSNDISGYTRSSGTGMLTALSASPFASPQPSSIAVDPTGKFAYVANSVANTVSAFAIAPTSGALTPISGSPLPAGLQPAALAISD